MSAAALPLDLSRIPRVDQVGVEERAAALGKRSIKKSAKRAGHPARDLDDRPDDARGQGLRRARSASCAEKAVAPLPGRSERPARARPSASTRTSCRSRRTRSRAPACKSPPSRPAFPAGQTAAAGQARGRRGAPSRSAPTRSTWSSIAGRSSPATTTRSSTRSPRVKEACGAAHLKVILETGELETYDHVRQRVASGHGRRRRLHQDLDGQGPAGRDARRSSLVMLEAIRDHYCATGRRVGMKPAGGVRTTEAGAAPTSCSSRRRSATPG